MPASIFGDKGVEPTEKQLCEALGKASKYWKALQDHLSEKYGDIRLEWKYYGQKSGWLIKTYLKKRNLFFTNPQEGYFRVSFIFGDKAVDAVQQSDLPIQLKEELTNARKYAEGRGLLLEVKTASDLENIKKLVGIKVNN